MPDQDLLANQTGLVRGLIAHRTFMQSSKVVVGNQRISNMDVLNNVTLHKMKTKNLK